MSTKLVNEVGMIGFGGFGQFFAPHLARHFAVTVHDIVDRRTEADRLGLQWGTLEQVAGKELVILAVPLQSMEAALRTLAAHIQPQTLVMDVCSVKLEPMRLIRQFFPQCGFLATHPLFGPQSAKDGLPGHKLVVCPSSMHSDKAAFMCDFFHEASDWSLELIVMEAEAHDREMSRVLALTHFIARAAADLVTESPLATVAYRHLRKVVELLGQDSWELFLTIQKGNPFAADVRWSFLTSLVELEAQLRAGEEKRTFWTWIDALKFAAEGAEGNEGNWRGRGY